MHQTTDIPGSGRVNSDTVITSASCIIIYDSFMRLSVPKYFKCYIMKMNFLLIIVIINSLEITVNKNNVTDIQ